MLDQEPWKIDALCHGQWNKWDGDGTKQDTQDAKARCLECPAIIACATYALKERPLTGVWAAQNVPDQAHPDARVKCFRRMEGLLAAAGKPVPQRRREQRNVAHGTLAGYRMHYRRNEPSCDLCRQANATRTAARRAAHKDTQDEVA